VAGRRAGGFLYDAEGNRVVREVGGVRTVAVDEGYEVRGGVARKVYRLGGETVAVREGSTVYAAVGDHLGSVTVLAQSGSVAGATRYLPYGVIRWETGLFPTDRRFTGQRWEASLGLYDYRARFYDPALGRFLQPDPIVPEPGNPQALNRYAYVYNNPLRYTDPSGHWLETLWDIASIAWDLYEIRKDPRNLWNWGALAVDIAAAALPLVPGGVGAVVHGSRAARAAAHADEAARLARIAAWLDRFAGAGPEVIRGVERLAKLVENERVPAQLRNGLAAELARAEEYFKAGKLQAVEAVIESGRVDLILVTGEMVEVKYWRQNYAKGHIRDILRQVKTYQATGRPVILEFVQTKTDPITEAFIKRLLKEAQKAGIPLAREQIQIIPLGGP